MSAEGTALNRTPVSLHPSSSGNSREELKDGNKFCNVQTSVLDVEDAVTNLR